MKTTVVTLTRALLVFHILALPSGALRASTPQDALKRMNVAAGFEVSLVASEPQIAQPITASFDARGRLWVLQYLQYPNPEGLEAVAVDEFLRTKYNKVPEPPPKGPKGKDRVTILEDKDGDGRYETTKDFVAGLNLASGMCLGYGGVFVAQPPYLLFYADKNNDDVPDGDPEVCLKGFGMEDAHAFANSLQIGPDGWIYGAQGSTVTANIRGVEFQQGCWRYHPLTKEFELFSEGGGNTWGLDFDRHGQIISGTNGGKGLGLHYVQGAYYIKGFTKHGPLHNPNTYGYFGFIPHKNFKGSHVTIGGIIYQGGAFPEEFRNQHIGANVISNDVYWNKMERDEGSSYRSEYAGDFLLGNDINFRPIDCMIGYDGAIYISDWYDKRASHVDPVDNWEKEKGRVYRVQHNTAPAVPRPDLTRLNGQQLIELLGHKNVWYRREARATMAHKRDATLLPALQKLALEEKGDLALEALWALHVSGGFNDTVAAVLLGHSNEDVRAWTIRLIGDTKRAAPQLHSKFVDMARTDPSAFVRSQLACTAKRLPSTECLAICRELMLRKEDLNDQLIPMLIWWAIEDKAIVDRGGVLALLEASGTWQQPLVRKFLIERIAQRYMTEGTPEDFEACARLFGQAQSDADVDLLLTGFDAALTGRSLQKVPAPLEPHLSKLWKKPQWSIMETMLAFRMGQESGYKRALEIVADAKRPDTERIRCLNALAQVGRKDCVPALLEVLGGKSNDAMRREVIKTLEAFNDPAAVTVLLERYPTYTPTVKDAVRKMLASRAATALQLLSAVDAKKIDPKEVPLALLRDMVAFDNKEIEGLIAKHWGNVSETSGEKKARIGGIKNVLIRKGPGDVESGHQIFMKACGVCHTLFGEGGKIGPDLTGADRKDLDMLLTNIVEPSAMIRPEFVNQMAVLKDGRRLSGLVVETTAASITIVDAQNQRTTVAKDQLAGELKTLKVSFMPEGLLDPMSEEQYRDLLTYIRKDVDGATTRKPTNPNAAPTKDDKKTEAHPNLVPGTKPLEMQGDLASEMVASIDKFLLREIEQSVAKRAQHWKRDLTSAEAYNKSVAANRERFKKNIGVVDARETFDAPQYVSAVGQPSLVAKSDRIEIHAVRWPVFRGVEAEGLLLTPVNGQPIGNCVAVPDADQTPEMLAGVAPGIAPEAQFARRLAESGFRVLVPLVLDRADTFSITGAGRKTNQPHREFVYRPAFEMGRHVIGYEVQKILAAVDWFEKDAGAQAVIGLAGHGEGGLLVTYAGAIDPRVDAVLTSGYFGSKQNQWDEPLYRNVWSYLHEFGDAELATLIAPRAFIVDPTPGPAIAGPPEPRPKEGRAGAGPGKLQPIPVPEAAKELERARALLQGLNPAPKLELAETNAIDKFADALVAGTNVATPGVALTDARKNFDPQKRLKRQFDQLVDDTQKVLAEAEYTRRKFWSKMDLSSLEKYTPSVAPYREHFYNEVIGRFEQPLLPPNPRSRKVYDEPKYTGYEVMLDVFPDVFAYGILLVPKDLKAGEKRPVVVCQHGLEGRPQDVADPKIDNKAYNQYAIKLAERGFITYAPQNPYIFKDRFRMLQRKLNLLKKSLFSVIVPQHQQTTDWLATLPFVDPERIGFYGLSYGGKTAMRVPALVNRYCLSICSADFNEWIWKNASTRAPYSYVGTGEWEIFEFDLGNTYNYAEMANLIAPRPFMVERGHDDAVAPDEWVGYEFARVQRTYNKLKIGDRAVLEVFDGPHAIWGVGTFEFLHKHLKWPKPQQ